MELDGTQVMKLATCDDDQGSNLGKKKEKTKPYGDQCKGTLNRDFVLPVKTQ
jgi:hypothetical protein